MSRQTVCTLTLEHCEKQRQLHRETGITETTYISPCQPALNTDSFTYTDDGNDLNPLP